VTKAKAIPVQIITEIVMCVIVTLVEMAIIDREMVRHQRAVVM
jgi:hypothetical protein